MADPIAYFDAHCHLQDEWLDPYRDAIIPLLVRTGLHGAIVNGTSRADWVAVATLAARHSWIRPSFGIHPWWSADAASADLERLESLLLDHPEASVGEIGLDRWILDSARDSDLTLPRSSAAPMEKQRTLFRAQLALAARLGRPATIHCLQAFGPLLEDLQKAPALPPAFLLHAYGGPAEMVPAFLKLGAYFSFNPYFLRPHKEATRQVFATLPADRLLVETDAPAMPPPPDRIEHPLPPSPEGKPINHPAHITLAYRSLAALRQTSLESLSQQVAYNFRHFYNIG